MMRNVHETSAMTMDLYQDDMIGVEVVRRATCPIGRPLLHLHALHGLPVAFCLILSWL